MIEMGPASCYTKLFSISIWVSISIKGTSEKVDFFSLFSFFNNKYLYFFLLFWFMISKASTFWIHCASLETFINMLNSFGTFWVPDEFLIISSLHESHIIAIIVKNGFSTSVFTDWRSRTLASNIIGSSVCSW